MSQVFSPSRRGARNVDPVTRVGRRAPIRRANSGSQEVIDTGAIRTA
jgi:hypothetical protein